MRHQLFSASSWLIVAGLVLVPAGNPFAGDRRHIASAFSLECRNADAPRLSVYVGNKPTDLLAFEKWLGRPVDAHQVHSGEANWDDWSNSIGWQVSLWKAIDRRILWSIPLIPRTGSLAEAASGKYDSRYERAARTVLEGTRGAGKILIRTGWEFNSDWMTWSAIDRADEFIGAYRRFVTSFRQVSDRFLFEWTPNIGDHGMNPEDAYPGDDYVDVIGLDFYFDLKWNPADPREAWKHMVEQPYGLRWHQAYSARRGKPTAYSEWGVMSEDAAPYVELAAAWFRKHRVVYHSYWDSDAAFRGKISTGQHGAAGRRFREAFGGRCDR